MSIAKIRQSLLENQVDVYFIPNTNSHFGEYIPDSDRIIRWACGFSGSAANLIIRQTGFAGLWTDSRYFVQAEQELAGSGVTLMRLQVPHTPEYLNWMQTELPSGTVIGMDGRLVSHAVFTKIQALANECGFVLRTNVDLIGPNWKNRPAPPEASIFEHDKRFAGKSRKKKLEQVRQAILDRGASHLLLSSLDDIAWLFNLRGGDVPTLPVFAAHAVIGMEEAALFFDLKKMPAPLQNILSKERIVLGEMSEINGYMATILEIPRLTFDPAKISQSFVDSLPPDCTKVLDINPTTLLKACKNNREILSLERTMITDGAVLVKFFYWLDQETAKRTVTEMEAQNHLIGLRKAHGAVSESFGPISAFGPNGALPHYQAPEKDSSPILRKGLYLLDSGGQYEGGTTDTTRVIALGETTRQERTDYTLVLKGLISCSTQQFPVGTQGYQLDALARAALWNKGINFGHGTGHGVGFFLDVHEGPQSIRPTAAGASAMTAFREGMVTSVEPGVYRTGKHGVRLENLVLCAKGDETEFGNFLRFETLTLAPIFTRPIERKILEVSEKLWLKRYNNLVTRKLKPELNPEEFAWLKHQTKSGGI